MTSNENGFQLAIYNALCSCLGLSPSSEQALALIRQAYTEPENSLRPARTVDVIYWSLSPESGNDPASYSIADSNVRDGSLVPEMELREAVPLFRSAVGSHKPTVHRYLAYQLLVVCYGPGCEAYVHKIRSFLYLDGAGLPRQILRKAGIYPVPDPPAPQLLYEPEGSLWRRRADLTIPLRVRDDLVYSVSRGVITSPPAVILYK
jgi:hypothetical protein